jgi:hypothetical protein
MQDCRLLALLACYTLGCSGQDAVPTPDHRALLIMSSSSDSLIQVVASQQRRFFQAAAETDTTVLSFLGPSFRIIDAADSAAAIRQGPFATESRADVIPLLGARLPIDLLRTERFEVLPLPPQSVAVIAFPATGLPSVFLWVNRQGTWKIQTITLNVSDNFLAGLRAYRLKLAASLN